MSICLLNKVLDLPLRPSEKLILAVMADLANEQGICWPSLAYVSRRASVSVRTLHRSINALEKQNLISRKPRYRGDGSRTSSEYIILPNDVGSDKLSQPPAKKHISPMSKMTGGSDTSDTPKPHRKQIIRNHHNTPNDLVYPRSFDNRLIAAANHLLSDLSPVDAQLLIDEVGGRIEIGGIRCPLSYLRALIKRHEIGEFIPEVAERISSKRTVKPIKPLIEVVEKPSKEKVKTYIDDMRRAVGKGGKSC